MKEIDLIYQTMFAELGQRAFDGQFQSDFDLNGRFVPVSVKGRDYWYFDGPDGKRLYVGPKADPEITKRVEGFKELKDVYKARRKLVSTLKRDAGLPSPPPLTGDLVKALAEAGLFRLRAVLVGTTAFQCYGGLLGLRLPAAVVSTSDADFAQDYGISWAVEDSLPSISDILADVDSSFRPVPHQADGVLSTAFVNARGYRVEFLTGNRGSDDFTGKPSKMPALGGAAAENLRYMDFLIRDPIRSVMLHDAGISVIIPAPARFAVHKLIVAAKRRDHFKQSKDLQQAAILGQALATTRHGGDLAEALDEARERGPAWRDAIKDGFEMLRENQRAAFSAALEGSE